uniref:Uncharacterized protein n=1 Tax=Picocystis salinarum TaxID=88271 RepID=A0A7S3UF88_9CHLO
MCAETSFLTEEERAAFVSVVTKESNLRHAIRTLHGFQLEDVLESLCMSPCVVDKLKEPILQHKLSTQLVHHALSDHANESQVRAIVQFLCKTQAYDCIPSMLETVFEYKDALASAGLDGGRPNFFLAELCSFIPVYLKRAFFDTLVRMTGTRIKAFAAQILEELYATNDGGTCKLIGELSLLSIMFFQATAMPLCRWATDNVHGAYLQDVLAYLLDGLVLHKHSGTEDTAMGILVHLTSLMETNAFATSLKQLIVLGFARLLPLPNDGVLVQRILQLIVTTSVPWPVDVHDSKLRPLVDCMVAGLKASSTSYADPCMRLILDAVDRGLEAEYLLLQPPTSGEDMQCRLTDGPHVDQVALLRSQVHCWMVMGELDVCTVSQEVCERVGDHLLDPQEFARWLDG